MDVHVCVKWYGFVPLFVQRPLARRCVEETVISVSPARDCVASEAFDWSKSNSEADWLKDHVRLCFQQENVAWLRLWMTWNKTNGQKCSPLSYVKAWCWVTLWNVRYIYWMPLTQLLSNKPHKPRSQSGDTAAPITRHHAQLWLLIQRKLPYLDLLALCRRNRHDMGQMCYVSMPNLIDNI